MAPDRSQGKRSALLCDVFIASVRRGEFGLISPQRARHVADRLLAAKRWVFDHSASEYVARMQALDPGRAAREQQFALPPFKTMYVEFDPRPTFEMLTAMASDANSDERVGYLYDDGRVFVLASAAVEEAAVVPISFGLHRGWSADEQRALAQLLEHREVALDAYFWGSAYDMVSAEEQQALRSQHSMRLEMHPGALNVRQYSQAMHQVMAGSAGELRSIVSMLIFLNRAGRVRFERAVGARPALIRRRPASLLSHSVVSFKLDPVAQLAEGGGGSGLWRRAHDVRGHFCHDYLARTSGHHPDGHLWVETRINQWRCGACQGLRWWRDEHRRGHLDKGVVVTDYLVKE